MRMRRQVVKIVDYVISFNVPDRAARKCVCRIEPGNIGYDAFGERYSVITDDYGVIAFVAYSYKYVK